MSLEVSSQLRFDGLHAGNEHAAHYVSFSNGGKPAEEVLETVHTILRDVHDERYRQGIIDAAVAHDVGGTAVLAILDHAPTRSEVHKLKLGQIHFVEWSPEGAGQQISQ